jgi:RNA polymerase sigma-70 factor, ECF subfamily
MPVRVSVSGMKSRVQRGRAQFKALLVACCEIEVDRRFRITGYASHGGPCECRGAAAGGCC